MSCYFEVVSAYKNKDITLPERKTAGSAAYDFKAAEDITIPSFFKQFINTFIMGLEARGTSKELAKTFEAIAEDKDEINKLAEYVDTKDSKALSAYIIEKLSPIGKNLSFTLDELAEVIKSAQSKLTLVPTGIKCKLEPNQVLHLYSRSSLPLKDFLMFGNSVGVVDSDYYNSEENEGHIFFEFINLSPFDIIVKKGDVIGQGEIDTYCTVDNDKATGQRVGGFGSTNG